MVVLASPYAAHRVSCESLGIGLLVSGTPAIENMLLLSQQSMPGVGLWLALLSLSTDPLLLRPTAPAVDA
jgi:hypothetical protein